MNKKIITAFVAITFLFVETLIAQKPDPEIFQNPSHEYRPYVWWHWMNGNISREGISKDLEAFKNKGIKGATILNIGDIRNTVPEGEVKFMSKTWHEMFDFALDEAERLGLELGFHNCDGWSTSGGPWITPENSMKELVWSKAVIHGGQIINKQLSQPPTKMSFYKDVFLLAYQSGKEDQYLAKNKPAMEVSNQAKTSLLLDGNPKSWTGISSNQEGETYISFDYGQDVTKSRLQLVFFVERTFPSQPYSIELQKSKDGDSFIPFHQFTVENNNRIVDPTTTTFDPVQARYFRLVFKNRLPKQQNDAIASMFKVNPGQIKLAEAEFLGAEELAYWQPEIKWLLPKTASVRYQNWMFSGEQSQQSDFEVNPAYVINISEFIDESGYLKWKAPAGDWTLLRLGYTTTGVTNHPSTDSGRGLECDKLDADALELHIESFAAKMIDKNRDHTGKSLKYILVDSWEALFQNWTGKFPAAFKQRRSYDIISYLPVIAGEIVKDKRTSEEFLYDFRQTISDLLMDNYYREFREFCHANHLVMKAEVIYGHSNHPPVDVLQSYSITDVPMTEFWSIDNQGNSQINNRRVFTDNAASAAHIYGKQIVRAEAFTEGLRKGYWNRDLFDRKSSGDYNFCEGINQMVLHCSPHQPDTLKPGFALGDNGGHYQRKNTYWSHIGPWIDYLSRCQYLLREGQFVADALYFIGDDMPNNFSVPVNYTIPEGYRADLINRDILSRIEVEKGQLVFKGGNKYQILVIPEGKKILPGSREKIEALLKNGATIIGPPELFSFPEYLSINSDSNLIQLFNAHVAEPDFSYQVNRQDVTINFVHRRTEDADIYFVTNPVYDSVKVEASFRVNRKQPLIWNPENGEVIKTANFWEKNGRVNLPLMLPPATSLFIVFQDDLTSSDHNKAFTIVHNGEVYEPGYEDFISGDNGSELLVTANGKYQLKYENETKQENIRNIPASVFINTPWEVTFPGYKKQIFDKLISWTELDKQEWKHYSGTVTYRNNVEVEGTHLIRADKIWIDLGEVKHFIRVFINDKLVADRWKPPYRIEVGEYLHSGNNTIKLELTNLWHNKLIGELQKPEKERTIWTTSPIDRWFDENTYLKVSGLIGPVKLIFTRIINIRSNKD